MELHLQALIDGSWQRAALLEFPTAREGRRGGCTFEYEHEYLIRWIADPPPLAAVSLNLPVEFGPKVWRRWPALLDDLQPMGSARGWWLRRLGLADEAASDFAILRSGTIAPVGNLRIEESVPAKEGPPKGITRTTTWEGYEAGGDVDWGGLLRSFGPDETSLREGLHDLASRLCNLRELLGDLGLPEETLDFEALDFRGTEKRLRTWGLL